jgi:hypothetical protein
MVRRAQRKEVNIVPAVGSTSLNPFDALSGLYEEYEYDLNLLSSFRLYTAIARLDDPNYDREKVKEAIYNQYKEASIKLVSTSHPVVIKIACEKEEDMLEICKNGLLIDGKKFICTPKKTYKGKKENQFRFLDVPSWITLEQLKAEVKKYLKVISLEWEFHKNFPNWKNGHVRCTIEENQNRNFIPGRIRFTNPENPDFIEPMTRVYFKGEVKPCYICGHRDHKHHSCPNRLPCSFCESIEHSPKDCLERTKRTQCYTCSQHGHIRSTCPNRKEVVHTFKEKKRTIVNTCIRRPRKEMVYTIMRTKTEHVDDTDTDTEQDIFFDCLDSNDDSNVDTNADNSTMIKKEGKKEKMKTMVVPKFTMVLRTRTK